MSVARALFVLLALFALSACKPTFSALHRAGNYHGACQLNRNAAEKDVQKYQWKMLRKSLGESLEGTFKIKAYNAKELQEIMGKQLPRGLTDGTMLVHLSAQLRDTVSSFVFSAVSPKGKDKSYDGKALTRLMDLGFLEKNASSDVKKGVGKLENYVRSYMHPSGSECSVKTAKYCHWFVLLKPTGGGNFNKMKLKLTWFLEGGGDLCTVSESFSLPLGAGANAVARVNAVAGDKTLTLSQLRKRSGR